MVKIIPCQVTRWTNASLENVVKDVEESRHSSGETSGRRWRILSSGAAQMHKGLRFGGMAQSSAYIIGTKRHSKGGQYRPDQTLVSSDLLESVKREVLDDVGSDHFPSLLTLNIGERRGAVRQAKWNLHPGSTTRSSCWNNNVAKLNDLGGRTTSQSKGRSINITANSWREPSMLRRRNTTAPG